MSHFRAYSLTCMCSLPYATPPLQSQTCSRPLYDQNALKSPKLPLFCRNSLQQYFAAKKVVTITNLQDQYPRATSNVSLSPTQLLSIKILFKRDSSFCAQIGFSTLGNRDFTNTSKCLLKRTKKAKTYF